MSRLSAPEAPRLSLVLPRPTPGLRASHSGLGLPSGGIPGKVSMSDKFSCDFCASYVLQLNFVKNNSQTKNVQTMPCVISVL